ncbi:hypothetical protein PPL_12593 [Heterostelium album PN500]|uniref:Uncharacterized protein n=1 Tax=Heterostelium pallidum (strain ATCC 26659 / Pp 5 / PN500) TaxID=670386 RepID=D3BN18_HETP5|nr:hypothetical protein PPL_12593 [Heterostelium album PN500]EFA77380.1 hypothetical protein PPL_12593 [Heterostelium album PN500]|eukprot:XP_020429509.1 hypothetical protein PPL_12593 [Heterostelium album PN500]
MTESNTNIFFSLIKNQVVRLSIFSFINGINIAKSGYSLSFKNLKIDWICQSGNLQLLTDKFKYDSNSYLSPASLCSFSQKNKDLERFKLFAYKLAVDEFKAPFNVIHLLDYCCLGSSVEIVSYLIESEEVKNWFGKNYEVTDISILNAKTSNNNQLLQYLQTKRGIIRQ